MISNRTTQTSIVDYFKHARQAVMGESDLRARSVRIEVTQLKDETTPPVNSPLGNASSTGIVRSSSQIEETQLNKDTFPVDIPSEGLAKNPVHAESDIDFSSKLC